MVLWKPYQVRSENSAALVHWLLLKALTTYIGGGSFNPFMFVVLLFVHPFLFAFFVLLLHLRLVVLLPSFCLVNRTVL